MTRHDLTRWNRASLSRFRYIDGNAATFLEELRQALIERFADHGAQTLQWESLVPRRQGDPPEEDAYLRLLSEQERIQTETERERMDRVHAQYSGERREWAWEIARVLARSTHVLGEYIDASTNEGFLRTATQWDNMRRMVAMLDYHPAPPASAETLLVIDAKDGARGSLENGFQVKYAPPDGAAPVVFETLSDIEIDADLNQLRPVGFDRSQKQMQGSRIVLESEVEGLEIGQPLVLEDEKTGNLYGHRISGLHVEEGVTHIRMSTDVATGLSRGYTLVHLKPQEQLEALGPAVQKAVVDKGLHLTGEPEGLKPGTVLHITDGDRTYYRYLIAVRGKQLLLETGVGELHLGHAWAGLPVSLAIEFVDLTEDDTGVNYRFKAAGDWSHLEAQKVAGEKEEQPATYTIAEAVYKKVTNGQNKEEGFTHLTIALEKRKDAIKNMTKLLVPPAVTGPWLVDTFLEREKNALPEQLITSMPRKTGAGDLAVVDNGQTMAWSRLGTVTVDETDREAALFATGGTWDEEVITDYYLTETMIQSHFKTTVRLKNWEVNTQPLTGNRIPLPDVPALLEKGRALMVESTDDPAAAFAATVAEINDTLNPPELVLDMELPAGFTYGNALLSANVISAGHGEIKGEKVLGSGDATRLSQSFVAGDTGISFFSDPTQPAGVKAAVDVKVAGRIWELVAGFQNSGPADAHYTVRMTEEGRLKIIFGDGLRGRRLPTGSNNVRLTYRKGTGLGGNLDAGRFTKAAKPHHLVDKVHQPLPAAGGNDMEGLTSLRENAPATLLTLERAVSLDDFDYLVTGQSSVWQAKAFAQPTDLGRSQKIEVVVVPAGGGALGTLAGTLADYIHAHSVPGLDVIVTAYKHKTFALDVTITVNNMAYNPQAVTATVVSALEEAFNLKNRKLGQYLYLSEVYQVVEAVTGVVNSRVVINGSGGIRRLPSRGRDVLTLGSLQVTVQDDIQQSAS